MAGTTMTHHCTVVLGPPAAGKTTWVHNTAQPGDLIVDFDAITQALSGPHAQGWTMPSNLIARAAINAREAAAQTALANRSTAHAYVIHACPSLHDLTNYTRKGAHIVIIDPGRATVMQRIHAERPADKVAVANAWYKQLPTYPAAIMATATRL